MAIPDSDTKILWGRAGGRCSNPACSEDLTVVAAKKAYNLGEMAHVIARSVDGPRGDAVNSGPDTYENLILLCPTCHTKADKSPGDYPEHLLRNWKATQEEMIQSAGRNEKFETAPQLKSAIGKLLAENRALWVTLGPKSDTAKGDPGSNLHRAWAARKLDTVLPNNWRIINIIDANSSLLTREDYETFAKFKVHAGAFEQHQYDRLDKYPLFPDEFEKAFST
ncbi:MAG TPA: HNH endonuclease signature motif containing protein [Rhizomicrobium sp.]|nr:HNH endonuclease signature motif containing protein [Rhizomicrobium sp.]